MYDEFFAKAHQLTREGKPFATAIVVRAEKPSSGKPGDKAIVTLDGVMYGWIGGSCTQPTLVKEARAAIVADRARLIRITPNPGQGEVPDGIEERPMTCMSGGTLDIYIEPQQPQPRLLIVGNLPVARALAHLGKAMSYQVIAVDPEGDDGAAMAHADTVLTRIADLAEHVTPLTFIVVATHGVCDEEALEAALRTPAPWVGLVSSRKRAAPIVEHLRRQGLDDDALSRLKVPAGLDIKAKRGDEIALSIMAEIVQVRRSAEAVAWTEPEPATTEDAPPATAVDPICGMTVTVAGARHVHEHQGTAYYFCCGGCLSKFAADPEKYVTAPSAS